MFGADDIETNFIGARASYRGDKLKIFLSFFAKDIQEDSENAFSLELHVPVEYIGLHLRYLKSTFDFNDGKFDFEGNSFSFIPLEGALSKTPDTGVVSIGIELDI